MVSLFIVVVVFIVVAVVVLIVVVVADPGNKDELILCVQLYEIDVARPI